MTALLLSPHNDDETLFAAFTILRHRPTVVTCFQSFVQEQRGGPTWQTREAETVRAVSCLGADRPIQLLVRDDKPDETMLRSLLTHIRDADRWDIVFAPAVEEGGHDQHNLVGELAVEIFGGFRVMLYLTYVRGSGKTRSDCEAPYEPGWPSAKLRAMAEYESQIELGNTSTWFIDETLREWYA